MSKRFLVDEAFDGTQEIAHFDNDGYLTGIEYRTDVESVVEANKVAQNDGSRGWGKTRELRQIASIPVSVLMTYCQKNSIPLQHALGGREQDEVIKRILKDPDYRYLRTDL